MKRFSMLVPLVSGACLFAVPAAAQMYWRQSTPARHRYTFQRGLRPQVPERSGAKDLDQSRDLRRRGKTATGREPRDTA